MDETCQRVSAIYISHNLMKESNFGPGRTKWCWAGTPLDKALPGTSLPGRQLTRSMGPEPEWGAAQVGPVPGHTTLSSAHFCPIPPPTSLWPPTLRGFLLSPFRTSVGSQLEWVRTSVRWDMERSTVPELDSELRELQFGWVMHAYSGFLVFVELSLCRAVAYGFEGFSVFLVFCATVCSLAALVWYVGASPCSGLQLVLLPR